MSKLVEVQGVRMTVAAAQNVESAEVVVGEDVADVKSGRTTRRALLANFLDTASTNTRQGWRDYVDAVFEAAGVTVCLYCNRTVSEVVPRTKTQWTEHSKQHAKNCEWTSTHAHTTHTKRRGYKMIAKFDVTSNPSKAREILEAKIESGRVSAAALFERINTDAPADSLAKGKALRFGTRDNVQTNDPTMKLDLPPPELVMGYGDKGARIHKHALGQLAQRAGVPSAYVQELANGAAWQRRLLAGVFNEHYHQGAPDTRYLVREVKGQVRGFLSDRYRRLDSRPLIETLATEAQRLGAVPVDGTFSDTRVALKILLPQIFEPVPGEVIAFGLEWGNSDFGATAHAIRAFMLRVWCLNGATMENSLHQVHLGRQMTDDIELSARTYQLDTQASMSALRDVVRGTLAPAKVEALCAGIQRANENKVEWKNVRTGLSKKLLKSELEAARNAFEGEDVYNLPPGATMWRVSNAISWIAGGKDVDADRKLELQRLAGELVDGRADRSVAEAA